MGLKIGCKCQKKSKRRKAGEQSVSNQTTEAIPAICTQKEGEKEREKSEKRGCCCCFRSFQIQHLKPATTTTTNCYCYYSSDHEPWPKVWSPYPLASLTLGNLHHSSRLLLPTNINSPNSSPTPSTLPSCFDLRFHCCCSFNLYPAANSHPSQRPLHWRHPCILILLSFSFAHLTS